MAQIGPNSSLRPSRFCWMISIACARHLEGAGHIHKGAMHLRTSQPLLEMNICSKIVLVGDLSPLFSQGSFLEHTTMDRYRTFPVAQARTPHYSFPRLIRSAENTKKVTFIRMKFSPTNMKEPSRFLPDPIRYFFDTRNESCPRQGIPPFPLISHYSSLVVQQSSIKNRQFTMTFGASYEQYFRQVPRWLPRLRRE